MPKNVEQILLIVASISVLSGCANLNEKLAKAPACKQSLGENHLVRRSGPGLLMSGGFVIPAKDWGATGKLDMEWGFSRHKAA